MQFVPMCVVAEVEASLTNHSNHDCGPLPLHCCAPAPLCAVLISSYPPNNINLVAANRPIAINYNQHDTRKIQTHHIRLFPHFSQSTDYRQNY